MWKLLKVVILTSSMIFSCGVQAQEKQDAPQRLLSARQSLTRFQTSALPADQSPDYITALVHYRAALELLRHTPEHVEYLPALLEFARLHESQEKWNDAAIYYGRAVQVLEQNHLKNHALRAEISARLAYLQLAGEVAGLAIIHARESLVFCAQLEVQQQTCMIAPKRVLADAYFRLGDYAQAAGLYQLLASVDQASYTASTIVGSQSYFRLRYWLSKMKAKDLSQAQAREALQGIDEMASQLPCEREQDLCRELLNGAVDFALYLGELEDAQARMQFAFSKRTAILPLSKRPGREWVSFAQIQLARGDLQQARVSLINALADMGDFYPERSIKFKTLAQYYRQMGNTKAEIFFLKRASVWALYAARHYRLFDAQYGRIFLAGHTDLFRRLSSLLFEQKRNVEALDILDMYKENLFLDYSGELPNAMRSAAHTKHGMTWKMRYYAALEQVYALIGKGDWSHLNQLDLLSDGDEKRLTPLHPSPQKMEQSVAIFTRFLDQFEEDFAKDHPVVPDEESEILVEQKRAMIKHPRAAMIEYLVNEDKLYIALLTHDRAIKSFVHELSQKRLNELVHAHRQAILNRRDTRPIARQLHQILMQAVRPELERRGIKELVLFPDPALHSLPFAALHDGRHYLVQDYAIQVVNQVEQVEHPQLESKVVASIFGNTLADDELSALPAVRDEVKALQNELKKKGVKTELFLDQQFDLHSFEAAVRERHQILHLATHYKHHAQKQEESYFLTGQKTA